LATIAVLLLADEAGRWFHLEELHGVPLHSGRILIGLRVDDEQTAN